MKYVSKLAVIGCVLLLSTASIAAATTLPGSQSHGQEAALSVDTNTIDSTTVAVNSPPDVINTSFNETYSGDGDTILTDTISAPDGGYLLIGSILSSRGQPKAGWVVKTDANGNEEWSRTIGGPDKYAFSAGVTANGGYFLVGRHLVDSTNSAGWFVQLSANGTVEQKVTLSKGNRASSIEDVHDGYLITGAAHTGVYGRNMFSEGWLVKLSQTGEIEWNYAYSVDSENNYLEFQGSTSTENGYLVAGQVAQNGSAPSQAVVMKVTTTGEHVWHQTYGGLNSEVAVDIEPTSDGGYVFAGQTNQIREQDGARSDAWLVKITANGDQEWTQTHSQRENMATNDVIAHSDGYLLAGVMSTSTFSKIDGWVAKFSRSGTETWNITRGGEGYDSLTSLTHTNTDTYVASGWAGTDQQSGPDGWALKFTTQLADSDNNQALPQSVVAFDQNGNSQIDFTEVLTVISAFNTQTTVNGEDVSFQDVLATISSFNGQ